MSTSLDKRKRLVQKLRDKEYRDLCVESNIRNGIAFQIRSMRDARKWTQNDLAARTGKKQEFISHLEDPNYGRYTLTTLRHLAAAFDVALAVRFVPFSQLADWITELSPNDLAVPSFEDDRFLEEPSIVVVQQVSTEPLSGPEIVGTFSAHVIAGNIIPFPMYKKDTARTDPIYQYAQATEG